MTRRRWAVVAACGVGALALLTLNLVGVNDSTPSKRGCERSDSLRCAEQRYVRLVDTGDTAQAMRAFRADYRESALVRAECHSLTHAIGRAAGRRYRDVGRAYRGGDRFCGSGFYHGVVEAIVAGPERRSALARPDGVCAGLRNRTKGSVDHFNCAHGIGHGFMAVSGNDVRRALRLCDRLRAGFERANCWAGVFMQNVMNAGGSSRRSRYLDPDRPLHPCDVLAVHYRGKCLERQILYALERLRGDFGTVFRLCSALGKAYREECERKVGGAGAELNVESQPNLAAQIQGTAGICLLPADSAAQVRCAEGAVGHFVYYFDGTREAKQLYQEGRGA
jgi:hypothetical protein